MKSIKNQNKRGKSNKTLRRSSKKKSFRKNKYKYYGGLDSEKNPVVRYLYKLNSTFPPKGLQTDCKIPNSKGGQQISICPTQTQSGRTVTVYKTPPQGAIPIVTLRTLQNDISGNISVCYLDSYTMNLLIQSIINQLPEEPKKNLIEHYDKLYDLEKPNYYYKTLSGAGYTFAFSNGKSCFSVEDFIKLFNTLDTIQIDKTYRQQSLDLLLKWIVSMTETLNYLWEKMQFHHCDPKAAQLFIDGDYNNNKLIVGDLDKVTFTLNIGVVQGLPLVPYRICLMDPISNYASKTYKGFKRTITYPFKSRGGTIGSWAESMRYNPTPNENNSYEIAAFISSILLLLLNNNTKEELYRMISENIIVSKYLLLINFPELKNNSETFEKKTSHKVACKYVNFPVKQLSKNNKLISSNVSIINDGTLVFA